MEKRSSFFSHRNETEVQNELSSLSSTRSSRRRRLLPVASDVDRVDDVAPPRAELMSCRIEGSSVLDGRRRRREKGRSFSESRWNSDEKESKGMEGTTHADELRLVSIVSCGY